MSTMKLPANYASISEEEMVYLDGGASDAYNSFLNIGKVFNAIARIFSGASSIINNVNVIYQSFLTLGDLLKSFCSGFYFHLFFKNCFRCGDSSFCF